MGFWTKLLGSGTGRRAMNPVFDGRVLMDGDRLSLMRWNGDDASIALNKLDLVIITKYSSVDGMERCLVELKHLGEAGVSVPTSARGFDRLDRWLKRLADFDLETYRRIRNADEANDATVLWQRRGPAAFTLSPEQISPPADEKQGIFLENLGQWLPWSSYEALGALPFVEKEKTVCPNRRFHEWVYSVKQPTLLGGLKLESLRTRSEAFEEKPKLHLPVTRYLSDIRLSTDATGDFQRIAGHIGRFLTAAGGEAKAVSTVGAHLSAAWSRGEVDYRLDCYFDETIDQHQSLAWLVIEKAPDLSSFYSSAYGSNLRPGPGVDSLRLGLTFEPSGDYRVVDNLIYTPDCFADLFDERHGMVIWHDRVAGRIGFAGRELSRVYEASDFQQLSLAVQNFRGSEGRNTLELDGDAIGSVSDTALFKRQLKAIGRLLGKPVNDFVYDDHY